MIALEQEAGTRALLDEVANAAVGVSFLDGSFVMVSLYLRGARADTAELQAYAREMVGNYNTSFYAPQVFIDAATRLARRSDLKSALLEYYDSLKQSDLEMARTISAIQPSQKLLHQIEKLDTDYMAFARVCMPRMLTSNAVPSVSMHQGRRSELKPSNYPMEAMDQLARLDEYASRGTYWSRSSIAHLRSLATLMLYFGGDPPDKPPPNPVYAAVREKLIREESMIAGMVRKATFDEIAQFVPHIKDANAHEPSLAYTLARQLPQVERAISERRTTLAGLTVAGTDARSFLDRARSNAPPSKADIVRLVTSHAMEDTRKATGYLLTRKSDSKFEFDSTGRNTSGTTEVIVYGIECAPEGSKQRCSFSTGLVLKEDLTFGSREYGLGLSHHNVLVYWSKDGLVSDDLRKQDLGWMERRRSASSSAADRQPSFEDLYVERDQENRQRYYDRDVNTLREPYDPGKRY